MNLADGRFLVPARYAGDPYVAKFVRLFERVAARLGSRVVFCDDVRADDLPGECPFVVVVKPVQWGKSDGFRGLPSLPPSIQVIGLWDDIHQGKRGTRYFSRDRRVLTRAFRRCNVILCTSQAPFVRWYPRYAAKLVHFPHFFMADDFLPVPYDPAPTPKCILSGATGEFYPLRRHAAENPSVVLLPHPGYGEALRQGSAGLFGVEYARELSRYLCGVTSCSVIEYAVAKYVELPAAGCLLLANYTSDLDLLGLIDGVNYLRVDTTTFDETLARVLADPGAFEPVRRAGFELARSRHADVNRADQLEQVIRERCGAGAD